jgi:hypothetical protein
MTCVIERVRNRLRERGVTTPEALLEAYNREATPMVEEIRRRLNDALDCLEALDFENVGSDEAIGIYIDTVDDVARLRKILGVDPITAEVAADGHIEVGLSAPLGIRYGGTGSSYGLVRGADLADGNATIQVGDGGWRVLPVDTLTGNSVLTLGNTGATSQRHLRIERRDATAFTYRINNNSGTELLTMAVSLPWYADFTWSSATSLFVLAAHGPIEEPA